MEEFTSLNTVSIYSILEWDLLRFLMKPRIFSVFSFLCDIHDENIRDSTSSRVISRSKYVYWSFIRPYWVHSFIFSSISIPILLSLNRTTIPADLYGFGRGKEMWNEHLGEQISSNLHYSLSSINRLRQRISRLWLKYSPSPPSPSLPSLSPTPLLRVVAMKWVRYVPYRTSRWAKVLRMSISLLRSIHSPHESFNLPPHIPWPIINKLLCLPLLS